MRKTLRPAFMGILIVLCGGIIFDPFWWYRLVYERKYLDSDLWLEPITYAIGLLWTIFFTAVTVYSVLVLSKTEFPEKLLSGSKVIWNEWVVGRKRWWVYAGILVLATAGLSVAGLRSRDEQKLWTNLRESRDRLAKSQLELEWMQKNNSDKNKPPLSEPRPSSFSTKMSLNLFMVNTARTYSEQQSLRK